MEGNDIPARSAPSLPHPHVFGGTESPLLRCKWIGCGEIFDSAASLHGHLSDVHVGNSISQNRTLNCMWDGCRNTASKRSRMLSHLLVHVPLRRHPCGECGKRFKWLNDLKKHLHKPKPCVARRRATATGAAGRPEPEGQQQEDVRDSRVQLPRFEPRLHDHLPLRPASVVHNDPESLHSVNLTPPTLENPMPSPIGDEHITDSNSDAGPYPSVAEMQAFLAADFDVLELYLTSPSNAEWCSTRNPGGPVMDGAGYSPEAPPWSKDDHAASASTIFPPTMQPRMQSLFLSSSSEEGGFEMLPVGSTEDQFQIQPDPFGDQSFFQHSMETCRSSTEYIAARDSYSSSAPSDQQFPTALPPPPFCEYGDYVTKVDVLPMADDDALERSCDGSDGFVMLAGYRR